MRPLRVPIWKLLALVALVGVAIAALRKPSDLTAGCVFSLTVAVLLLALVGAIAKPGNEKPPYLGCVLFGCGYLASALPAFDFGAILAYFLTDSQNSGFGNVFLLLGGLPFLNIWVLGLPLAACCETFGFIRGFEAAGAVSLTLFGVDYLYDSPFFVDTWMKHTGGATVFYDWRLWIPDLLIPHLIFATSGGLLVLFVNWFVGELRRMREG